MESYYLNNAYTTLKDIQGTIDAYNVTRSVGESPVLNISATLEIKKFDVLFIAYFIAFKLECPELTINLSLPHNVAKEKGDVQFTLLQYGTYAYLMTGTNIFNLTIGNARYDFDLATYPRFKYNSFVISKNFMLLLTVNKGDNLLYQFLYEERLTNLITGGLQNLPIGAAWDISAAELLKNINKSIRLAADPRDRYTSILDLARMAFYRTLAVMRVLSIHMDLDYLNDTDKKNPKLRAGGLQTRLEGERTIYEQYDFYLRLKPLIEEISEHSLIHQFMYSTIVSSKRFPGTLTKDTAENFYNLLVSSWRFTKETVYGLKELIKNIRQHTPKGVGVITGRIYEKATAKALRETAVGQARIFERYIAHLDKNSENQIEELLELNIIDLGNEGIMPKLLKNSRAFLNKHIDNTRLSELISEDIALIENDFGLKHLLSPPGTKRLHQQMKRSIAHWGFNIFTKLINKNFGLLLASTTGKSGGDDREGVLISNNKSTNYTSEIRNGTILQVIFPIIPKEDFVPHFQDKIQLPTETTEADIRGLEELFQINMVDWKTQKSSAFVKDQKNLLDLVIPRMRLTDRTDEEKLWQLIESFIKQVINKHPQTEILYHVNLDLVVLDSSQLLRLLGLWEDSFPRNSLMISNVQAEIFEAVINLNIDFYREYEGMSFWNTNAGIVCYSYISVRGNRFYFADVLWGDSTDDYLVMNKLVARTNFNYTTLFLQSDRPVMAKISQYPSNPAFYNKHVLLPLDILLESSKGLTLFEHNSQVLLENTIKPASKDQV